MTGTIRAVCASEKKGTAKENVGSCKLIEDYGLENDAHAGSGRQVSLLSWEAVEAFARAAQSGAANNATAQSSANDQSAQSNAQAGANFPAGAFGENLLVQGLDLASFPVGTRLKCGGAELEITQIGKKCHSACDISKRIGKCLMPSQGVFARVEKGGVVSAGDRLELLPRRRFTAAIIVASDRSSKGEREDKSGPALKEILEAAGFLLCQSLLLPDEQEALYKALCSLADVQRPDLILTSGGTGFSPRDVTPEATLRAAEKNAPGIAEALRAYSMTITPRAMLSRGASVIRGSTLIVNLPGSPKAAKECCEYLLPVLEHAIPLLRGEVIE